MADIDQGRLDLFKHYTRGMPEARVSEIWQMCLNMGLSPDDPMHVFLAMLGWIREAAEDVPQSIRDAAERARADLQDLSGFSEIREAIASLRDAVLGNKVEAEHSGSVLAAMAELSSDLAANTAVIEKFAAASTAFAATIDRKDAEIAALRVRLSEAEIRNKNLADAGQQARLPASPQPHQQIQTARAHPSQLQQGRHQQSQQPRPQVPQALPKEQPKPSLLERLLKRDALIGMGAAMAVAAVVFFTGIHFGGVAGANEKAALSWADANDMRGALANCRQKVASGSICPINLVVP
ncbi:hypothetical protein SAE02_61020 [Skermanella aerolata]|uniref:Uncharacterized protein n=1 Tax=Skermanella aerolata TaxID=393310 RepID=A0A512DZP8_9PROT|nr:hypothetical protein [Skermanella aerolata]KJB91944.1 hypothetical protein N826_25845 [Skermanella aerolata KACC 11604]GEO41954.1 hypothetical protein SAE02_61020 [Skermanella aerolata]